MTPSRFLVATVVAGLPLGLCAARIEGQAPRPAQFADVVAIPRQANGITTSLTDDDAVLEDGTRYDEFAYPVQAGQRVVIEMSSDEFDTLLRVGRGRQGAWRQIAWDDDGGDGTNSRIELQSDATGELIIRAGALFRDGRGEYSLRFPTAARSALPSWVGTWVLDPDARGGGQPEWLRFHANGTGEYETRYWRGMARFTWAAAGEDRIIITGLPNGWTASAQRFPRGTIQLHVDRGNNSVGLLPFNRAGAAPAASEPIRTPAPQPAAQQNPFVGRWREVNTGGTLEVFADGRATVTGIGSGSGAHPLRYTRTAEGATLSGYPNATATMRVSETGTLFINYSTTSGSRGMGMYRRAEP